MLVNFEPMFANFGPYSANSSRFLADFSRENAGILRRHEGWRVYTLICVSFPTEIALQESASHRLLRSLEASKRGSSRNGPDFLEDASAWTLSTQNPKPKFQGISGLRRADTPNPDMLAFLARTPTRKRFPHSTVYECLKAFSRHARF